MLVYPDPNDICQISRALKPPEHNMSAVMPLPVHHAAIVAFG